MDYYLADRFLLPPGQFDDQFTEKIVRLPAKVPFLPYELAPAVNALPALSNGYVTFGSFNRPNKLSVKSLHFGRNCCAHCPILACCWEHANVWPI